MNEVVIDREKIIKQITIAFEQGRLNWEKKQDDLHHFKQEN